MTGKRNSWIMTQTWEHLLFAHWPVPVESLRRLVPAGLEVDTFEGQAWIGVIPFWISAVQLRFLPVMRHAFRFPEVNVRTYVTENKKPGVFFLTLDAAHPLVVNVAKLWYHLPYYTADMSIERRADTIHFQSERRNSPAARRFQCRYRPVSPPFAARTGTLEHWLTERYRFYCRCPRNHRVYQGDVWHRPWELQRADAEIAVNTLVDEYGFNLPATAPPLVHYSRGVNARVWPTRLSRISAYQ